MDKKDINKQEYMAGLIAKARQAQLIAEQYDQKRVDTLCAAVAWAACKEDFRRKAAQLLVEESNIGLVEDKFNKIANKAKGVYRDMKDQISVGVVETDSERGLAKYIKPMGVIGALIPVTNGEATPIVKALWALKTRNAIVMSPHPKGKKTAKFVVDYIHEVLKKYDAPVDLVQTIDPEVFSMDCTDYLLKNVDFIAATGGTPMVRVAYSSGVPAIGVGTGNVTTFIDNTADLDDAAAKIMASNAFDNSSSCSSENSAVVDISIYDKFLTALEKAHCYIIKEDSPEKAKLQAALWPSWPKTHDLSRDLVGKTAQDIAKAVGLNAPEGIKFIAVEENGGFGHEYPYTGEKLSPIVTLIKAKDFDDAMNKMEETLNYQGKGHSCGIHTKDNEKVNALALRMKVSRIMVNQAQALANSGSWSNGMPVTMTLGCSTWGFNSTSNNVTWKDMVNYTTVSWPIEATIPADDELFPEDIRKANP
jgi:sulfoacetaldehyde dehydrogenase